MCVIQSYSVLYFDIQKIALPKNKPILFVQTEGRITVPFLQGF